MKRLFIIWFMLLLGTSSAFAQIRIGTPPLVVQESDGSPKATRVNTINVGNGDLTKVSNSEVTIATGGGAETNSLETVMTGVADDEIPVGSSADTATYIAIPNCPTEATDKLLYTAATNTLSCGADQTGAGGGDPVLVNTVAVADASGVDLTTGTAVSVTLNAGASPDTATFDVVDDSIGATELADDDFGDFTCADAGGGCTLDTDTVGDNEIDYTAVTCADLTMSDCAAGIDLGTSQAITGTTAITIGDNNQTIAINSSDWDIDATGIATGMGNITSNGTVEGATLTEGGQAVYNATETPGGELGGTWASPTIDDSVSVTSWTLVTPGLQGKIGGTGTAVNDDDCTGEQGSWWWDSTDTQFEFCNDNSGTPTAIGTAGAETNALESDGASGIADTEVFIGTGAGTGNYAALSGDVTMANTGAVTIASNSIDDGMMNTTWSKSLAVQSGKISGGLITLPAGIDGGEDVWVALFDASQTESMLWQFRYPDYCGGTPVANLTYSMASATANKVDLEVDVMAVADGQDPFTEAFDTTNEVTGGTTVPGTADQRDTVSITLSNNDGIAAGEMMVIRVNRDHDDADDTATGDLQLLEVEIECTR